ncbi:MAG: alginate lyase family protein [Bacilli bacterium]
MFKILIDIIKSKKSIVEIIRMIFYRLKRYIYIFISRNSKLNPEINLKYINEYKSFITNETINMYTSEYKHEIIKESDLIIENIYEDISGNKIYIKNDIDWNYDYIFNYKWKKKHFSKYTLKDKQISTDVKHVWEFSRFYHLVVLAQAYLISNDDKYVKKILEDINSWDLQNQFNYSVNWTVAMEVSIRVVNLIQCISLIRDSDLLNDRSIIKINNIIYKHAIYIWNNLEKGLNTNNHYLSNLIGLIWISIYFNKSNNKALKRDSRKWLRFALRQLDIELGYQIYDDGFSYEDSTSYHCLNLEMLLLTIDVLNKNQIEYSDYVYDTTEKMAIALDKVLINNNIPVIGDIDNGRLIKIDIIANRDKTNFRYLLSVAKDIFGEDFGWDGASPFELSEVGIYRIFNNKFDAIIRCGPIGVNGIGGHSHNDQLSFVLIINQKKFIVDPGTGYYSGDYELRHELRSTKSHNTLYIENYEQNDISKDLFRMEEKTNSEVIMINENLFVGKHYGYSEPLGIIFERRIELSDDKIEIIDTLNDLPNQNCYLNFILDNNIKIIKQGDDVILEKDKERVVFQVKGGNIIIDDNQPISKSYGKSTKTTKIVVLLNQKEVKTSILIST